MRTASWERHGDMHDGELERPSSGGAQSCTEARSGAGVSGLLTALDANAPASPVPCTRLQLHRCSLFEFNELAGCQKSTQVTCKQRLHIKNPGNHTTRAALNVKHDSEEGSITDVKQRVLCKPEAQIASVKMFLDRLRAKRQHCHNRCCKNAGSSHDRQGHQLAGGMERKHGGKQARVPPLNQKTCIPNQPSNSSMQSASSPQLACYESLLHK